MQKYIALAVSALLVVIDHIIKAVIMAEIMPVGRVEVVSGFFYLTYVENRGAAFGILQGKASLLAIITGIALIAVIIYIVTGRAQNKLTLWSLSLILAGGVGNFIDRIFRGYVVDYLDFSVLFGFPVFNFADCCVVVGTALLICALVWGDNLTSKTAVQATVEEKTEE